MSARTVANPVEKIEKWVKEHRDELIAISEALAGIEKTYRKFGLTGVQAEVYIPDVDSEWNTVLDETCDYALLVNTDQSVTIVERIYRNAEEHEERRYVKRIDLTEEETGK